MARPELSGALATEPSFPAPAKINLFLHVLGRRDDGYHELQTAFQFLEFGDELTFQPRDDGRIERQGADFGADDLVLRAARLLRQRAGVEAGVTIGLRKRIPVGGGLGGGSSDAATTLRVLDRLWNIGLPEAELMLLARSLGADVPVFVAGQAAFAEGVGEKLTPIAPPERWYLVLQPDCRVPTAEVFANPALTRDSPRTRIPDFVAGRGQFRNDCTPVVRHLYPQVAQALNWLNDHADARLSGTGACLYAGFDSRAAAQAVCDQVPQPWQAFVARGTNRSPLLRAVDSIPNSIGA